MAHAETVARGACACCGKEVAVKVNRGAKAYYRCDWCGVEVRHHWQSTSDRYMRRFAEPAAGDGDNAAPAKRGDSPAVTAPKARPVGGLGALFGGGV